MIAVNAVLIFPLVWALAVCQADEDVCRISCDDMTGSVRNKVTFTCRVSQKCSECCVAFYKFQYLEKLNDSVIFREDFPDDACDQRNTFTCSFTPTTAMNESFRFFLQTLCDTKQQSFNLEITERSSIKGGDPGSTDTPPKENAIFSSVVGSIFILILIVILMAIYFKKRSRKGLFVRPKMFQGIGQDENNPENRV